MGKDIHYLALKIYYYYYYYSNYFDINHSFDVSNLPNADHLGRRKTPLVIDTLSSAKNSYIALNV
jgi:hypothetical protein